MKDIHEVLLSCGLDRYSEKFKELNITLEQLIDVSKLKLDNINKKRFKKRMKKMRTDIGMPKTDQKLLYRSICKLAQSGPEQPSPPAPKQTLNISPPPAAIQITISSDTDDGNDAFELVVGTTSHKIPATSAPKPKPFTPQIRRRKHVLPNSKQEEIEEEFQKAILRDKLHEQNNLTHQIQKLCDRTASGLKNELHCIIKEDQEKITVEKEIEVIEIEDDTDESKVNLPEKENEEPKKVEDDLGIPDYDPNDPILAYAYKIRQQTKAPSHLRRRQTDEEKYHTKILKDIGVLCRRGRRKIA